MQLKTEAGRGEGAPTYPVDSAADPKLRPASNISIVITWQISDTKISQLQRDHARSTCSFESPGGGPNGYSEISILKFTLIPVGEAVVIDLLGRRSPVAAVPPTSELMSRTAGGVLSRHLR